MKCSIKNEGLVKVFDVDGKTVYPSAYMSYVPLQEDFDDFKKHGVNVFMFGIYAGDEGINMTSGIGPFTDNFFKGYGEYDFSMVEKVMNLLAPTGKEDIYVIPRVCLEPPKWWQKLNPDELAIDQYGQTLRYSFTSNKWREDMTVALKALIDYFENSKWKDMVIGYHIAAGGTEEWTYQCRYDDSFYDFSKVNLEAYHKYLEARYGTAEALSKAWNRKVSSFKEVEFPHPVERTYAKKGFLRKEETEKDVLDYFDFHNEAVAETINYFCKQVKEYTNGERVTGAFYGYVAVLPTNKKGLHALNKLFEQPYVDFISTTNWFKEEGGPWLFASAVQSALLNGKMWIAEGDLRTSKSLNISQFLSHVLPKDPYYTSWVWQPLKNMEMSESVITKGIARVLTAPCGIWWFGMFGRWFSDERMMTIIDKLSGLLANQKRNYLKTDVAVIIDEKSYKYIGINEKKMNAIISQNMKNMSYAGFTYHTYLLSDIKKDNFPADDYKMYIFSECISFSDEDKAAINKKLKNGGKTLLWLHCSAYADSDLCDFRLEEREDDVTEIAEFNGIKYSDLYTVKDGKFAEDSAFMLPSLKFAEEEDGYIITRFSKSRKPAILCKKKDGYTSFYSLTLALHPDLYRYIAMLSGVHIYTRKGDCIYAGGEYIGLHAVTEGCKKISLPERGFKATNALTGEPMEVRDMFVEANMKEFETIVIHVEKEDE